MPRALVAVREFQRVRPPGPPAVDWLVSLRESTLNCSGGPQPAAGRSPYI